MKKVYKSVMDPDSNGLGRLPKVVRFQLMVTLSFFWSTIFCISAGVFVWLPSYLVIHIVLLAVGIFGTGWIFKGASTGISRD
jgi:hypothetical protein